MIETYVKESHELISRRWKKKGKLANQEIVEIGEPDAKTSSQGLSLSNVNPIFLRKDTQKYF